MTTTKKKYTPPTLAEYGRLESLTRGALGSLPDYLGGQLINANCETYQDSTITRTSCHNVVVGS